MNLSFMTSMNSPRLLTFPTAIKGVLITGVNDVDPGVIGTVNCISYLCLCWRKPKWTLTIDSPFIRSCISVFAVTSSGKCTWWPAKIWNYIRQMINPALRVITFNQANFSVLLHCLHNVNDDNTMRGDCCCIVQRSKFLKWVILFWVTVLL